MLNYKGERSLMDKPSIFSMEPTLNEVDYKFFLSLGLNMDEHSFYFFVIYQVMP